MVSFLCLKTLWHAKHLKPETVLLRQANSHSSWGFLPKFLFRISGLHINSVKNAECIIRETHASSIENGVL
ncbi:Os05g0470600 [Oryza sativa Japonica Group]|uniref:Os05g0470600 protein n=3 Tax=Oryza TaxID=4527 RepID=Q6AUJ5_ORYSJ|nr:unknown protein [Oryza sativa Japonica Group]AAT94009.1 unknown protein [Oryza sativa Japonica Group]KAB8099832.1 hypothetical protein EE612_030100 [Oryza sativa]BAF17722.1 Os05g0470600 [Oryza sativa Japonica Group]BAS94485.1 Os05g0470600 [Oryza sativa Japonica Group]|eukprot:NP_001055808.1 Os05g0470600 [Oryza sativa Japonica Group]